MIWIHCLVLSCLAVYLKVIMQFLCICKLVSYHARLSICVIYDAILLLRQQATYYVHMQHNLSRMLTLLSRMLT